jgi:hypothetical protein
MRGGSGPPKASRVAARPRPSAVVATRRPLPLPVLLPPRVRLRPLAVPRLPSEPPRVSCTVLSVDELLAGWVSSLHAVHEPDTLDDCADYSRYLDELNRARHDADALCRRLHEELGHLVAEAASRRRRLLAD